jgi:hypothetical protein
MNDFAGHRVGEVNIGAHVKAKPSVRPLCRAGTARINYEQLRAIVNALKHVMEKDWVRFARVGTPKQDRVRIFGFTIRTGASARAEDRRQTGDAGGVSSTIAAINVVRPHYGTDKLLRRIVELVGGLRTAEHSKIARIVPGNGLFERSGNALHGFIPAGGTVGAIVPDQRLSQPALVWKGQKNNLPSLILILEVESAICITRCTIT